MSINRTHLAVGVNHALGPLVAREVPTPTPGPRQLLVKLLKLGFTPLSLWQVDFGLLINGPMTLGGNLVGEIVELGGELTEEGKHKVGDKIMSFQFGASEFKPAQEFVLVEEHNFSLVPPNLSLEEAATIPDSFVTAYHSLATELGVPLPTSFPATSPPPNPDLPILVWGGATNSGQYVIQLLHASGYRSISATASPSHFPSLTALGATHLYPYSVPLPSTLPTPPFSIVLDCVGDKELTVERIAKSAPLAKDAKVAVLLPVRIGGYGKTTGVEMDIEVNFPEGVEVLGVRTHFYQRDLLLAETLQTKIMYEAFASGVVKPSAFRVVEGETLLERCRVALDEFRGGKVHGEKLIC